MTGPFLGGCIRFFGSFLGKEGRGIRRRVTLRRLLKAVALFSGSHCSTVELH